MLDYPHGLENGEEHVVVAFELGPLVRLDRVSTASGCRSTVLRCRRLNLVRLVQADQTNPRRPVRRSCFVILDRPATRLPSR
jgi:hypothetical protein